MICRTVARLLFLGVLAGALSLHAAADVFYVDPAQGNDVNDGSGKTPFRTVEKALNLLNGKGGEIHLSPGSVIRDSIRIIRKNGTPELPILIDGHGSTVNLGTDITQGPWKETEDGFLYDDIVPPHRTAYGTSVVFVNGLPLYCDLPNGRSKRAWHEGFVRHDENGKLIVGFPKGLSPKNAVVVLTGKNDADSCFLINGSSHIVVKNFVAVFAGNDGYNLHGHGENFVLDHVTALFNGDEGISAHETYQVDTKDSEVAFSGSADGGIADVNESETTYDNVRVHQNRAAGFKFVGRKHSINKCVSFGNPGGNLPQAGDKIAVVDCTDAGNVDSDKTVPDLKSFAALPLDSKVEESDRLARFLQYRPPQK